MDYLEMLIESADCTNVTGGILQSIRLVTGLSLAGSCFCMGHHVWNNLVMIYNGLKSEPCLNFQCVCANFRCLSPDVDLVPSCMDLGRCFLRYPYQPTIRIENKSNVPVKYTVLSQECSEDAQIVYLINQPEVCLLICFIL